MKVEVVTKPASLGEGPFWRAREKALYYVDIFEQKIHRLEVETGVQSCLYVEGGPVTLVVPVEGTHNQFIVSVTRDLRLVTWPNPSQDSTADPGAPIIASVDRDCTGNRFNDGKCDGLGYLWAGTMGPTDVPENDVPFKGSLYHVGGDRKVTQMLNRVSISNGLAWSSDGQTLYYVDTAEYKLEAFDCDLQEPSISNRRTIFDYRKAGLYPSFPDGLTIDRNGRLWVSCFGAGKVHCINPGSGQIEDEVTLPATNITSVTFGGRDLADLYVTSTTKNLTSDMLRGQREAGAVFRVTGLNTKGLEADKECKINL